MYEKILFPVDLGDTDSQEAARRRAVDMAKMCGAELHVLNVLPLFAFGSADMYPPEGFEEQATTRAHDDLKDYVDRIIAPELIDVQAAIAHGTVYKEIIEYSEAHAIDLIVLASHRPELSDYLLGPNAARVVRHANCSVMVIRGEKTA